MPSGHAGGWLGPAALAEVPMVAARAMLTRAVSTVRRPPRVAFVPITPFLGGDRLWRGAGASRDAVPAGLGDEVGVVTRPGVVLGLGAFAGVGGAVVVGELVVAVGDRGQAGGGAGGHAEVVEQVAVVVAAGGAGDAALADPAEMHHRGDRGLGPGSAAEHVEVLGEEHRPGLVLAGVGAGLPAGLEVGGGGGAVEHQVHLARRPGGQPRVDGGGGRRAVVDPLRLAPVLAVAGGEGKENV